MAGYDSVGSLGTASNPFFVTQIGATGTTQVEGNVALGGPESGNPVRMGATSSNSTQYIAPGTRSTLFTDIRGNLKIAVSADDRTASVNVTSDTIGSTEVGLFTASFGMVFTGTAWVRQRGDTAGTDFVSAVRPTAGGALQYSKMATADTNAAVIKASAGRLYGYQIFNNTASAKYVRLYNKATTPAPATDNALIVRRLIVPANGVVAYHVASGLAGFTSGIGIAATGAAGDTDATALALNDLVINVDYA